MTYPNRNYFLLLFFIGVFVLKSQENPEANALVNGNPESQGISEKRLERIDGMFQEAIENKEIPGAVALVARNGKIVYYKAFGVADHTTKSKFRPSSIFRIASQTKAITSTAVMMLWEEGKFKLDDPISKWIPEFKNPKILDSLHQDGSYTTHPAKNEITIRHLLTHTSGLGYGQIDGDKRFTQIYEDVGIVDLFTTDDVTVGENIKKLAVLPLHHEPGSKFYYGEGLDVLGYFVEIISGMPFDQFLKSRLFNPLGMEDTFFYLPKSKHNRLVPVQTKENGNWIKYPTTFYNPDYPKEGSQTYFSGGAGLVSTALDYTKFLQMYLNKGVFNGHRILSRKTIELIMSHQVENLWANDGKYYGLAFSIVNEQGKSIGGMGSPDTFDWGGYFNTKYFADPKENLIGVLMKQTYDIGADSTTEKFLQLVYQAIND